VKLSIFSALTIILGLSGCVSASSTSLTDPDYIGRKFSSVIVFSMDASLDQRQAAEKAATAVLRKKGVQSIMGLDIAPPTRGYEWDGLAEAIDQTGFEAVLIISRTGTSSQDTYVPQINIPGYTYGTVTNYGNTSDISVYQSPSYSYGGFVASYPTAQYSVVLFDLTAKRIAWRADVQTKGALNIELVKLAAGAAKKAVKKLSKDGLLSVNSSRRTAPDPPSAPPEAGCIDSLHGVTC